MTLDYYRKFRFEDVRVRFSTHDPANKDKFVDNPELWKFSEQKVQEVIDELKIDYFMGPGEAAFYGPKLDFQAKTGLGREESISTTQLDFASGIRFELSYVGEDGKEHRPYIVHRAPLGAHERFIAFLIEHFGGAFPTWMAPIQARIIPVGEVAFEYAKKVEAALRVDLFRTETDLSDNSFNKKIREAVTHKIPNMVILGAKEAEREEITLRRYCTKEQITMPLAAFVERMRLLQRERLMDNFEDVIIPAA
jgi:threonyl-tRNA synthetase